MPVDIVPTTGAIAANSPFNEARRLDALQRYDVLDSEPEQAYDDLTTLAAAICRVPIALISLVDNQRQWFKSAVGIDVREMSREVAFCAHAILQPDQVFEVQDAHQDQRFAQNPLVLGDPHIRFYAGAPLVTPQGLPVGTVCVIDREPRQLNQIEREGLKSLARQVVAQLELRQARATLERESLTDPLTGLWNRRAFERRLHEEWMRHSRSNRPLTLLAIDVDWFKRINDNFGHPVGDAVLAQLAVLLRGAVRVSDLPARTGGEEFSVLLPETDTTAALLVAQKLQRILAAAHWPHQPHEPITVSIGIASQLPQHLSDPHSIVAQADRALYAAKKDGRNRARVFNNWL